MTLNPVCESVETAQGVPLTVTGVAQVKIMKNADLLQTASEQFLGKKEHEIKEKEKACRVFCISSPLTSCY